jgi:cytochrome P450
MTDTQQPAKIEDWATQFDHTHPDYAANAPAIWDDLRERCPVAHSDAFGGTWLPTRHDDVAAIAHDTDHFTSEGVIVSPWKPEGMAPAGGAPPITSDPPFHARARRLLLPAFSPKEMAKWEPMARESCRQLLDELLDGITPGDTDAIVDAAVQYTQHIPVRVIADMLGVPREDGDKFRRFIHRIIEAPGSGLNEDIDPEDTLDHYLTMVVDNHRANPKDDLVGFLMDAEMDGQPLADQHIGGTIALLLIAGIDTTWSAIGASLWHLAQSPADRRRLVEDPKVLPFAIEEFLRFYAPVTMARLEVTVAVERFLARTTTFSLADPAAVRWSTGQVRGPRELPVRIIK